MQDDQIKRHSSAGQLQHFMLTALPFLLAAAPFLLAVAIYLNSLGNPLLWDDAIYIASDPFIRHTKNLFLLLNPLNLWYVLPIANSSRPVWVASALLDMIASGGALPPMRMTSILINGFNASLLYCAALLLCARPRAALLAALLFAAHPLHTENVDILSFRTHMLALMLTLTALIFRRLAQDSTRERRRAIIYNAAAALSLLMAMLSHEIALVALPLFLIYEFLPHRRAALAYAPKPDTAQPYRKHYIWLSLLAVILVFFTLYRLPRGGYEIGDRKDSLAPLSESVRTHGLMPAAEASIESESARTQIVPPGPPAWHKVYDSPLANFLTMSRIFGEYLLKLCIPYPLQADYNPRVSDSPKDLAVWLSWAAWLTLAALCWRLRKRSVLIPAGFAWLTISLLPMSNIIRIYNIQAERYLYFPSAGFCLMAGGMLDLLAKRVRRAWFLPVLMTPILLIFSFITIARNRDYKDALSFYSATIKTDPTVPRALVNLARHHMRSGDMETAHATLLRAVAAYPEGADPRDSLAEFYLAQKNPKAALETLAPLFSEKAQYTLKTRYLHALILEQLGKPSEAAEVLDAALNLWPGNVPLLTSLAHNSLASGRHELFLNQLKKTDLRHTSEGIKCYAALFSYKTGAPDQGRTALGYMNSQTRQRCEYRIGQAGINPQ